MKGVPRFFFPVALALLAASVSAQKCGEDCNPEDGSCSVVNSCNAEGKCACKNNFDCLGGSCVGKIESKYVMNDADSINLPTCDSPCLKSGQCGNGTVCNFDLGICECENGTYCAGGREDGSSACYEPTIAEEKSGCNGTCGPQRISGVGVELFSCKNGLECLAQGGYCACGGGKTCSEDGNQIICG